MIRRGRAAGLIIGGLLSAAIFLVTAVSFFWTPYSPTAIAILERLQGPSAAHWLGTDPFGRDVASMLMVGAQNSLTVALVGVTIGLVLGVAFGTVAAARGGVLDALLMRVSDIAFAFPALLTAVMLTALFGPDGGILLRGIGITTIPTWATGMASGLNAMLAIGIFNIPVFARITRGAAMSLWKREFVTAARAAGRSDASVTWVHILPNLASVLIVQVTIQFALAIVAEAGLSYVGLGTQPPNPSWGRLLYDSQTFIDKAPLLAIFPGLAITLAVLGLNLLGDGLRDLLDPRLRIVRYGTERKAA